MDGSAFAPAECLRPLTLYDDGDPASFGFVDRQLDLAARHGLKLGLLWFGSNRGGSMCFPNLSGTDGKPAGDTLQVPPDVSADRPRYRSCEKGAGPTAGSIPRRGTIALTSRVCRPTPGRPLPSRCPRGLRVLLPPARGARGASCRR